MMPLGLLSRGESAEIMEIRGAISMPQCCTGRNRLESAGSCSAACRVEDIGLRAGKTVVMLSNEGKGAVLLKVGESRIAVGRGIAMKIMVRRKEE
ncbi:MAG TPA: FeoA family protein [Dissulfurispiraceae bacterium]